VRKSVENFISENDSFTTGEFARMLMAERPDLGRSTVYGQLARLCKSGRIVRIQKGRYASAARKDYSYELSEKAREIASSIINRYPSVNFQIWELDQLNEFVNHLLIRNTIFIEAESGLDESLFNLLFEKYPHVLHNPRREEYFKYAGTETIVVRKLTSETPPPYGKYRQASLEKILVDLFGRGIARSLVSPEEYRVIYEDAFRAYRLNQAKMFRYARRRGVEDAILDFIYEKTNIALEEDR